MHATTEVGHKISLPALPYALDALAPRISKETLEYHYGKHHRGYVNKLNQLLEGSEFEGWPLDEIVKNATGALFNNAAQVWNHSFYWNCLSPTGGGRPSGRLSRAIDASFGSYEAFVKLFTERALEKFGSGWTWLVIQRDGSLAIRNTDDADNPLRQDEQPLLTCDVWEHAYYIDYRNARVKYLEAFFKAVNWEYAVGHYETSGAPPVSRTPWSDGLSLPDGI